MRIKAFSLMELIVVILLLGIMFSLALTSFKSKKDIVKIPTIEDLPSYIQKLGLKTNAVFLVYGSKCKKEKLLSDENLDKNSTDLPFHKSFKTYKMNNLGIIKEFDFDDMIIDKKEQHICFKLGLRKGKFVDKFILKTTNRYLLFMPFFQKIKTFDSLSNAQKAYLQTGLYPKSTDDYYRK